MVKIIFSRRLGNETLFFLVAMEYFLFFKFVKVMKTYPNNSQRYVNMIFEEKKLFSLNFYRIIIGDSNLFFLLKLMLLRRWVYKYKSNSLEIWVFGSLILEYDKKYFKHTYLVREWVHNSLIDKAGHIVSKDITTDCIVDQNYFFDYRS